MYILYCNILILKPWSSVKIQRCRIPGIIQSFESGKCQDFTCSCVGHESSVQVFLCGVPPIVLSTCVGPNNPCSALQNVLRFLYRIVSCEQQIFRFPKAKVEASQLCRISRPFKASKPNFPALASGWAGSAMCILSHAIRLQLANMCKLVPHSISRHVCPYHHVCPYLISTLPKERSNKTRFQFASPRTAHNCRCSRMFKPQSR